MQTAYWKEIIENNYINICSTEVPHMNPWSPTKCFISCLYILNKRVVFWWKIDMFSFYFVRLPQYCIKIWLAGSVIYIPGFYFWEYIDDGYVWFWRDFNYWGWKGRESQTLESISKIELWQKYKIDQAQKDMLCFVTPFYWNWIEWLLVYHKNWKNFFSSWYSSSDRANFSITFSKNWLYCDV